MRVIETKWLFWADGFTVNTNLILIKPKLINKESLVEHEKVHVKQMQKVGVFYFWFKYLICSDFRFKVEAEAYATSVTVRCSGSKDEKFLNACAYNYAYYLSRNYFLFITRECAHLEIMKYLK